MRIGLVTEVFLPAVDGVVTRLMRTLEQQQRCGDEVLVIAPAGAPERYAGARVLGMRALSLALYPDGVGYPDKRVALPQPALRRALRAFRPDLIHAVNPVLLAAGAVYHARREGVPLVASYHAHLPTYARLYGLSALEAPSWRYLKALHNQADLNLCTSKATMKTLQDHGIRRLELWPHGVSCTQPEHEQIAAMRKRLTGGRQEMPLLLYVGRLAKEKQVHLLKPVAAGVEGAVLAIVGDGPLRGELEAEFAGTATTFAGLLTGTELAAAYAAADVFVFPSVTETLGLVLVEAQAAGLPVIACDSPVSRELITDGASGLLYEARNVQSMLHAVRALAFDPERRAKMSEAARASVQEATWERATEVLRSHYQKALEAHGARVRTSRTIELMAGARMRRRGGER